jgi:colicin import membrane protein
MNARLFLSLLAVCGLAHAGDEAQRSELRRQRAAIEAEYAQRDQACRQQFVVTPCLERSRGDKQSALQVVRKQEIALDDQLRAQRAQAQAQRVAEKTQAAQRRGDKPVEPQAPRPARAQAPRPAKSPSPAHEAPDRSAAEKRQREAFESRQREIRAHREAVEKRNAERATRKPAKALPAPGSAAAP